MIIKCEGDSYTIPSFKMLAMKVVGNNIFCDDMKSVSIINTNTMLKTKIINNRNANTFLYSIYHDELLNTLFLAFEDKSILGIDPESFVVKSNLERLDHACTKMAYFSGFDNSYRILCCENGVICIF